MSLFPNDTLLNVGVTAMAAAATHMSLHTAIPNDSGSNAATSARVATGWPAGSAGDFGTLTGKSFTGGAAGGPVAAVGFWSAATGGTFYGHVPISAGGDTTFNSAGEYTIASLPVTGSAV
jgi:hypothetical protein